MRYSILIIVVEPLGRLPFLSYGRREFMLFVSRSPKLSSSWRRSTNTLLVVCPGAAAFLRCDEGLRVKLYLKNPVHSVVSIATVLLIMTQGFEKNDERFKELGNRLDQQQQKVSNNFGRSRTPISVSMNCSFRCPCDVPQR